MSIRASAARYAKALFDVASAEGVLDQVGHELANFATLMADHAELQRTLLNRAIPTSAKRGVIEQILALSPTPGPLAKLLAMLADRDRLELVPAMAEAYRARLMEHRHVVEAEVVTATPLDDSQLAKVQANLARATGSTVVVTRRTDPTLIGGVIARIGGTVYDGSVATQLAKLRERLSEHI